MKKNDVLHGFRVEYSQELTEIGATLWRMKYEKNGAELIWLERKDDNKTFAIAFKTIPADDTGVFHILEHSVLCGSDKYPVKEPFVELLKGSMATFLNAFTFPDKTMYPVSSRNPQDFLNLIDVYMDAVLHPLSITDPHAFRQEGWHYELESPSEPLRCNGVVYNEMKGAYASYGTVLASSMDRLLFPDTCYGFESGGAPEHIPELTYENYLASHHRFYHPSNARIILDGEMDLDAVLAKLDGFLSAYEKLDVDADIPYQSPVSPEEQTVYYEIGAEESEKNKAILAGGWVFGDYKDVENSVAFSVLADVLASSNESPLPKALLDAGLAEEVYFRKEDGIQQLYTYLVIRNTDPDKKEETWALAKDTLQKLAAGGLDRKRLHSTLSHMEFSMREKNFGNMPRGLVYAMTSLESWLYGGDPAQNLCYNEIFASLRKKIDEGWFEDFLRSTLLDNPHCAKLCMLPSKTLGQEKLKAEEERLAGIKATLNTSQLDGIINDFAALRKKQEAGDTPEQLTTLPRLSVSDIPESSGFTPQKIVTLDGVTVLDQPINTDGITYLNLRFDLSDMPEKELSRITFWSSMLGSAATEHYSAIEIQSELQGKLGRFGAVTGSYAKCGQTSSATPFIDVKLALLENSKPDAVRLLDEVLNHSDLSDVNFVYNILRQYRMSMEQSVTMRGNSFAAMRAASGSSARGVVEEAMHGITMLRYLQSADKSFEGIKDDFCRALTGLSSAVFTKKRLTVCLTGEYDEAWIREIMSILSDAPMGDAVEYRPAAVAKEGVIIPAEIGFAARSANLNSIGAEYSGVAQVAAQLLSLDYLWNQVRVKGGAYGTGMGAPAGGQISLTTYRDPSPARSLEIFDGAGQALRDFCESGSDLEKYIISTVAATEPVLSAQAEGERAAALYFAGRTHEDMQRERREILGTTGDRLMEFSRQLDEICAVSGVCVIGGKNTLDACGDKLDSVETL